MALYSISMCQAVERRKSMERAGKLAQLLTSGRHSQGTSHIT